MIRSTGIVCGRCSDCMDWRKIVESSAFNNIDSRACVRVGNDVSEWFPVNVGLRQGCLMSPCFFNVYMDDVVR